MITGDIKSQVDQLWNAFWSNSDQIEFVDMIIGALSKNGIVDPAQLYDPPFTHLIAGGLAGVFDDKESAKIVDLVRSVKLRAVA